MSVKSLMNAIKKSESKSRDDKTNKIIQKFSNYLMIPIEHIICSGTNANLQEIEFNCIRFKLQENVVKLNKEKAILSIN